MSLPMDTDALSAQMMVLFQQESQAGLAQLREALDEPVSGSDGQAQVQTAFRALHTLRGSSAMNGLTALSELAGALEARFERLRNGSGLMDAATRALTQEALVLLTDCLQADGQLNDAQTRTSAALRTGLSELAQSAAPTGALSPPAITEVQDVNQDLRVWALGFGPGEALIRRGIDVLGLIEELDGLGEVLTFPICDRLPALNELNPDSTYLRWNFLLRTHASAEDLQDVFMFVALDSALKLELLADHLPADWRWPQAEALQSLLGTWPLAATEVLQEALGLPTADSIGDGHSGTPPAQSPLEAPAPERVAASPADTAGRYSSTPAGTVAVPTRRLDRQIDLVGELVIAQSVLVQLSDTLQHPALRSAVEQVVRLTTDMRDSAMHLRMVPVGSIFADLHQALALRSQQLERPLELLTEGGELEIDLTVLQALRAPLLQLLLWLAEHGMETRAIRQATGKPGTGRIALSVQRANNEVLIALSDDGAGTATDKLSDVAAAVESLHGVFSCSHIEGQGTRFNLRLPLTQGIIDGLLVSIQEHTFVLPLGSVEEVIDLQTAQKACPHGQDILALRDQVVPFVRLSQLFDLDKQDTRSQSGHAIIVRGAHAQQVGILVDHVIGQHQTVVKSLPTLWGDAAFVSGATILGNGTVALILDVPALLREAELLKEQATHGN